MKRNRLSHHWLMVALMNKMDRRRNIYGPLKVVRDVLRGLDDSKKRDVLIEALVDIMEAGEVHYFSSGCADFDVRIDMRPIEERHRDHN